MLQKLIALLMFFSFFATSGAARSQEAHKEAWLRQFSAPVGGVSGGGPGNGGLMQLLKFRDAWWVNTTDQGPEYIPDHPKAIAQRHPSIRVPRMFVTDLASFRESSGRCLHLTSRMLVRRSSMIGFTGTNRFQERWPMKSSTLRCLTIG